MSLPVKYTMRAPAARRGNDDRINPTSGWSAGGRRGKKTRGLLSSFFDRSYDIWGIGDGEGWQPLWIEASTTHLHMLTHKHGLTHVNTCACSRVGWLRECEPRPAVGTGMRLTAVTDSPNSTKEGGKKNTHTPKETEIHTLTCPQHCVPHIWTDTC